MKLILFYSIFYFLFPSYYSYGSNQLECGNESFTLLDSYEFGFDGNSSSTTLSPLQDCSWNIYIPRGTYAYLTANANIVGNSSLIISDSNEETETIMASQMQPYVFVGPKFEIQLKVGDGPQSSSLQFRIVSRKFPEFLPKSIYIHDSDDPLVMQTTDASDVPIVFSSDFQISLVSFPSAFPELSSYLRLTAVFDGPCWNSTYMGNLFQILRSSQQIVSSGPQMTVFSFIPDQFFGNIFAVQSYTNVANIKSIQGVLCSTGVSCPIFLNSQNGSAAVMVIHFDGDTTYLKGASMEKGSQLKVYNGGIRPYDTSNIIAIYEYSNSRTNLPQKFSADLTTYVMDNGDGIIEITEDKEYANWEVLYDGRQGFIKSDNYGINSLDQDIWEKFGSGNQIIYNFNFSINTNIDLCSSCQLVLSVTNLQFTSQYVFSNSNPPVNPISTVGTNFSVDFTDGLQNSTGFFMNFEMNIHKDDNSSSHSHLSILLCIFLVFNIL